MNYDVVITNGLVVFDNEATKADIAIKDGKFAAFGKQLCSRKNY